MALVPKNGERRRSNQEIKRQEEEDLVGSLVRLSGRPISPKTQMEQEKKIRREIANSNERRRMQSINSGFQSLRTLLPHHDGEKLSKAAILQHTSDYIYLLEQEKTRLLAQNCQLKRLLNSQLGNDSDGSTNDTNSPLHKRVKTEKNSSSGNGMESCDSSDEGVALSASHSPHSNGTTVVSEQSADDLRKEMVEVRVQLDRERRLRMQLEEQIRALESQLYPERIREITQSVQMQFTQHGSSNGIESTESEMSPVDAETLVAETIEIETHSCPNSPARSLSPFDSKHSLTSDSKLSDTPQDLSSKANSKKSTKSPAQPAAIALPIDVPFITDTLEANNQTVTLEIIAAGNSTYTTANSTSRQNLDTIVEAIRHLEGDHLFRDDDVSATVVVKSENGEELMTNENTNSNGSALSPALRTVLTMSPEQFGAIRHQVIQLQRPGVIVANHA